MRTERRAPLSVAGYQRMIARAGVAAKFTFLVHSHMLRHACGFKLANDGHDTRAIQAYLGHRSIMSTVRYTALTPNGSKTSGKINFKRLVSNDDGRPLCQLRGHSSDCEVFLGTLVLSPNVMST
jgi:integrase